MDVSPRDLRSHDLHEVFRGYVRSDVDELLERAAETIDRLHDRIRDLGERVATAESEAGRSREVEETLRRVLVAAQRTADQLTAESREQARDRLSKAEARSSAMVRDAEARSTTMLDDAEARSTTMLEDAEARSTALLGDAQSSSAATLGDAKARAATMLKDAESHSTAMVREAQTRSATLISTSESKASRRAEEITARHRSEIDGLLQRRDALRSEVQTLSRSRDGFLSRIEAAYRSELEELARRRRSLRTSAAGDSAGALGDDGPDRADAQDRDPGNRDDEVVVDGGDLPAPAAPRKSGQPSAVDVSGEVRA